MQPITQDELSMYSAPIIGLLILVEIVVSAIRKQRNYSIGETVTNFYMTGLAIGMNILCRGMYLVIYGLFFSFRLFEISDPWIYWIGLVVAQDFLFYWLHYVDHYSRLFWAVHVTHHNSTEYNFTTGFRSSVFQPLYRFIYYAPLALFGFHPLDIMLVYSATQIWGIFIHTNTVGKLPAIIEYIFVTPSHHRVHHGSNVRYLDKNMGMFLIIWDRMFGTFQRELEEDPVEYGLTTNPENRGPINIVFHEWNAIAKDLSRPVDLKTKLKYVFYPPGWSHDGSSMTSEQLRKLNANVDRNMNKSTSTNRSTSVDVGQVVVVEPQKEPAPH